MKLFILEQMLNFFNTSYEGNLEIINLNRARSSNRSLVGQFTFRILNEYDVLFS